MGDWDRLFDGSDAHLLPDKYEAYKDQWRGKTTKQIEREIESWRRYMQKHTKAYAWHGGNMTPPSELADGDKLNALREILDERAAIAKGGEEA